MGLDIGKWFRERFTHLPASKNSLADILGEDVATALKAVGRHALDMALQNVLNQTVSVVDVNIGILGKTLKREAKGALREVTPEIEREVEAAIDEALKGVRGQIDGGAAMLIKADALKALYRRLGL